MHTSPPIASAAALLIHDLKNALGAFEARLQARAQALQDPVLLDLGADCADLRRRMVEFLTLQSHPDGLSAHPDDEDPAEQLERLARQAHQQRPHVLVHQTNSAVVPAFAHYDGRLVSMALEAAMHNALRFTRGHIWLHAQAHDGGVLFRIDDDGPGPKATRTPTPLPRVRPQTPSSASWLLPDEPDTQPQFLHDDSHQATGLGTALCSAVAQAHRLGERRGWVRLDERPEGGARFELWLP